MCDRRGKKIRLFCVRNVWVGPKLKSKEFKLLRNVLDRQRKILKENTKLYSLPSKK